MTLRYLLLTLLIGAAIGGCGPMHTGLPAPAQPRLSTKPVLRIEPGMHTATIKSISAAGRFALTASDDKTARLWDARSGALLQVYRPPIGAGNEGKLYACALSPDGRWVAVGGWIKDERTHGSWVYLFDRATGTLRRRLTGPVNVVKFLTFSPDGQRLAATTGSGGLHVWRTDTWELVFHARDCKQPSYGVAWQAGGEWVTTCLDGVLRRYAADGRLLGSAKTPGGRYPYRVAAHDGQIAVGYADSAEVDLFAADLRHLHRLTTGAKNAILSHHMVIWSTTGVLHAAGKYNQAGRYPVRRWPRLDAPPSDTFVAQNTIMSLAALPDGGVAWAGFESAWGTLSAAGQPGVQQPSPLRDFRGTESVRVGKGGRALHLKGDTFIDLGADALLVSKAPTTHAPRTTGLAVADWLNNRSPTLNGQRLPLERYEFSRSLSIHPNGMRFALGADWLLRAFDDRGTPLWQQPAPGPVWGVNHTADGRYIVAAYGDGVVRWHREQDGAVRLSLYLHPDGKRWILWTPDGYYDAAPGAEDLLGWHVNRGPDAAADFYPASRFRDRFYRPDIARRALDFESDAAALAALGAGAAFDAVRDQPPSVTIISPTPDHAFTGDSVAVTLTVRSPSGLPVYVDHRINNRAPAKTRAGAVVSKPFADGETRTIQIAVPRYDARLTVIAETRPRQGVTRIGTAELTLRAIDPPTVQRQPALYVLAVGVSTYSNGIEPLTLAHRDAERFAAAWAALGATRYSGVHTKVLPNPKAGAVLDGFDWLRAQVKPGDLAVVLMAGHGHKSSAGYYFLPTDADPKHMGRTYIGQGQYAMPLAELPGQVLLFLDTCYSKDGAVGELARAMTDPDKGVWTYAATSSSTPLAQERAAWGGGVFTTGVVHCLKTQRGAITPLQLGACIESAVAARAGNSQRATFHPVSSAEPFVIYHRKEAP